MGAVVVIILVVAAIVVASNWEQWKEDLAPMDEGQVDRIERFLEAAETSVRRLQESASEVEEQLQVAKADTDSEILSARVELAGFERGSREESYRILDKVDKVDLESAFLNASAFVDARPEKVTRLPWVLWIGPAGYCARKAVGIIKAVAETDRDEESSE